MAAYFRPDTLAEALRLRARHRCTPLAGGTDFYPAESHADGWARPGLAHASHLPTLDLGAITAPPLLRTIRVLPDRVEIGALVTWRDALDSALPAWFDGVRLAAREVGGAQIQNRATLAGNLCNASPAADGVAPLLTLDARLRLQSETASRELALAEFVRGNRRTALADDELLTAIILPRGADDDGRVTRSGFLKLGARRYLVISIAMAAATLDVGVDGRVGALAVAVGACSAVARRLTGLEQRLAGRPLTALTAPDAVDADDLAALTPIDDVRASAGYRRRAAQVLVRRLLAGLADDGDRRTGVRAA